MKTIAWIVFCFLFFICANHSATNTPSASPHQSTQALAVINNYCDGDAFDGADRRRAKTSISKAKVESYNNLNDMIATLPPDDDMGVNHNPRISKTTTSTRVVEENRNVHIKSAWIYAYKRETDEDYHVLIGSSKNKKSATFFNIEVSGLPSASASSYARLKKVRSAFEELIGDHNNCSGKYEEQFMSHPKEIEFTGSLFFDILHYENKASIGHKFAKAKSYWEVHPVSVFKSK